MSTLDRYIGAAILKSFALVLVSLTALMSLSDLVREIDDLGDGRYGLVDAMIYIGLTVPERALDLAPISALVGCILGLGGLASRNEVLLMRAGGMSLLRLCGAVLLAALPLAIAIAAASELGAPSLSQRANLRRRIALSEDGGVITEKTVWLKEKDTVVRIGQVVTGGLPVDLQVFRFDASRHLAEVMIAERAILDETGSWVLQQVQRMDVAVPGPPRLIDSLRLDRGMASWDLDLILTLPDELSVSDLIARTRRPEGGERTADLERVLWRKLTTPFLAIAMMLLGLPFVLGQGAGRALGRRIALGALVGVIAYLLVQMTSYLGVILALDAVVVAVAPIVFALLLTAGLLLRFA